MAGEGRLTWEQLSENKVYTHITPQTQSHTSNIDNEARFNAFLIKQCGTIGR